MKDESWFMIAALIVLSQLIGNSVGLIGSIFSLNLDDVLNHLERLVYVIPLFILFVYVYGKNKKVESK